MTAKQAQRLANDFRTFLAAIRDAAIRCKGKAEVAGQCDAETEEETAALNRLCNAMGGVVKTVDAETAHLPSLEALMSAKKAEPAKPDDKKPGVAGKVG